MKAEGDKDQVVQKWDSMTGVLETIEGEEENVLEYVRCYWTTGHGTTRTKVLYDKIRDATTSKAKAIALATDLEVVAHDYAAILLSSHPALAPHGEDVKVKIEALRSFGVVQVRPLLLAAFQKFSKKGFSKLLDNCVSWSVRSLLSGVPSGTLERFYSRAALSITKGEATKAHQISIEMLKVVPDDPKFQASVARANVSNKQLARYYLRAMQGFKDGEPEPQYVPNPGSAITLEHILPEKAGAGWEHWSEEDKKTYLNRLGNQVLLAGKINSKLGNVAYAAKKPALLDSKYTLTQDAAKYAKWGPHEVDLRQKELAELAVKTWPLRV